MPIKEIITFSTGVLLTILAMNGPFRFKETIRKTQIQILREVGRTDNWGNPSIFQYDLYKNKKFRFDCRFVNQAHCD